MENLYTTILFLFMSSIAFSQNPIVKEELFTKYYNEDQFTKIGIIERQYKNDLLINEKQLSFEEEINNWYPRTEIWFDLDGNEIRKKEQFYQGASTGYYIADIHSTYSESGQLLGQEEFIKQNKNADVILMRKEEVEYIDNCSFVSKSFFRDQPKDEQLTFKSQTLMLFDEECRFVEQIYSDRIDENSIELKNKVRIHFDILSDGNKRRIVEQLVCPDIFECDKWERISLMVFDEEGRIIVNEDGSRNDDFRSIQTTTYEADKSIQETKFFLKQTGQDRQSLYYIEELIKDKEEKDISYTRLEQTSFQKVFYLYNKEGLLIQENREFLRSSIDDDQVALDTIRYDYQFYCDGQISEKSRISEEFPSRTIYSYLHPIDCGNQSVGPISFTVFPNPATNILNIEGIDYLNNIFSMELINNDGRILERSQNNFHSIDISNLVNGLYFIKIKDKNGINTYNQTFVISR